MTSVHYPWDATAALRALTDDLDDAPDTRLPQMLVTVTIQFAANSGTDAQRIAAVDQVTFAALGVDADVQVMSDGPVLYSSPTGSAAERDGLLVRVYTTLTDTVDASRPAGGTRHLTVVRTVAA